MDQKKSTNLNKYSLDSNILIQENLILLMLESKEMDIMKLNLIWLTLYIYLIQNTIEPYDGIYELTVILSDTALDNPIIWNFGKIEAKFRKPLDPSNLSMTYKNIQKPKMEPSFPPEVSINKNFIVKSINIVWGTFQWNHYYPIILLSYIP